MTSLSRPQLHRDNWTRPALLSPTHLRKALADSIPNSLRFRHNDSNFVNPERESNTLETAASVNPQEVRLM
jgi:hypothetical protein